MLALKRAKTSMDKTYVAAEKPSILTTIKTSEDLASAVNAILNKDVFNALSLEYKKICQTVVNEIKKGNDPLGDAFCQINKPIQRRKGGQTFTPQEVVTGMLGWVATNKKDFSRIVDPGSGSGRFVLAALTAYSKAEGIAIETDPLLCEIIRANAEILGVSSRLTIVQNDYRDYQLPTIEGATLFIGNPPYVRHHDIPIIWKEWYALSLKDYGEKGTNLAGLHMHFFLRTLQLSREGDTACFITSAEWLGAGYGKPLKSLMVKDLGLELLGLTQPSLSVFPDAMTTACITGFNIGKKAIGVEIYHAKELQDLICLEGHVCINKSDFTPERDWSTFANVAPRPASVETVKLGELFRVSRGFVTGANKVWLQANNTYGLPSDYLIPVITDAREIINNPGLELTNTKNLLKAVCLPENLTTLSTADMQKINSFIEWAREKKADSSYTALSRKCWWSVKPNVPAPIVMTYMGRRPPVFVLNKAKVSFVNIAHGLYPKRNLTEEQLLNITIWLNKNVTLEQGRTYAGGLVKFEPSNVANIDIPLTLLKT